MNSFNINQREKDLELLRQVFDTNLQIILEQLKRKNFTNDLLNKLQSSFVNYYNEFERMIDDFQDTRYSITNDQINRIIEDAENMVNTLIEYWSLVRLAANKYGLVEPKPSPASYGSTQRLIKAFCKQNRIKEFRNIFIENNLPTIGFDMPSKHSKFLTKNQMLFVQLPIGLFLLGIGISLSFIYNDLTGVQYWGVRILESVGTPLILISLVSGFINIRVTLSKSLIITASGGFAVFVLLYSFNPPSPPNPFPDIRNKNEIIKDTTK